MNSSSGKGWLSAWLPIALLVLVLLAVGLQSALIGGAYSLSGLLTLLYLVFVAATVLVIRRVTTHPGRWLGRRRIRRGIVGLACLCCLAMVVAPANDLGGSIILLILFLALCNVLLARATEQITVSVPRPLDERQGSVRNRAYRLAYWLLASGVGSVVLVTYLASTATRSWLGSAADGGPLIVVVALLICLPSLVVAWQEPDRTTPAPQASGSHLAALRIAAAMVAITLVAPVVAAIGVEVLPAQTTALTRTSLDGDGPADCANLRRVTEVGFWFTARFALDTQVCWNGSRARYLYGMNQSDCLPTDWNLVSVTTTRCVRRTVPDGTLDYTYVASIQPDVLSFLRRRVVISVVINRDGQVERST